MSAIDSGQASVDLLAAVTAIQRRFIADVDPRPSFDQAIRLLLDLSDSKLGFIGEVLHTPSGESYLKTYAMAGTSGDESAAAFFAAYAPEGMEFYNLQNLMGAVIRTRDKVIANSVASDPRSGGIPPGHPLLEAFLGLPFFGDEGDLVGMAGLANRFGGYDDELVAQLLPLCDALGVMIVAARWERRRCEAEAALRASEARFQTFVDHITDGLFLHDESGRIVDVNRRACESLGYKRDEIVGMYPVDFDPVVTSAGVENNMARLAAGETLAFDTRHRRKDGSEFPVEVRVRPLRIDGTMFALALACDISERKQAEEAIREQYAILQAILDSTTDYVYMKDRQGRYVTINAAAAEAVGKPVSEIIGRDDHAIFPPEVAREIAEKDNRLYLEELTQRFDEALLIGDQIRHLSTAKSVCRDSTGKVIGLVGITRDVTAHVEATQALLDAQRRLAIILKGADVGLWDWDLTSNEVVYSEEWKSQLGYSPDEILNRYEDWRSRVHPDDLSPTLAKVKAAIESCSADYNAEFRMRHKDGSWRWILALGFVIADEGGKPIRMLGVHIDITKRKRAEDALRESEARLRTMLENLDKVAVQAYEPDGTITFWNKASELFYGYSAAEALGRDLVDLLHSEHTRDEERRIMAEALRTREPLSADEVEVVRRDGSKITVFASRIVHARPGKPPEFFCFDVDITDKRRAEEELAIRQAELLHASRLTTVGQMVAELSHEVAQPLSAIGNFAAASDRILDTAADGQLDTLHEYIRAIMKQNQRCVAILERLRDFSRRAPASRSECDLGELLLESVDLILNELRRNRVKVRFDLASGLPPVSVDRIQLQQVVVNLLTNARDAMRDEPQDRRLITVHAFAEDDGVAFDVVDRGIGLSADVAAHLFDPFFTTKEDGMGIGLSICQSIMNDHGGRIEAFSNQEGGATFRVRLPLSGKRRP